LSRKKSARWPNGYAKMPSRERVFFYQSQNSMLAIALQMRLNRFREIPVATKGKRLP
jgi:hypothetical protein